MMDRVYYLLIKEKLNVLKDKETASSQVVSSLDIV